MVDKRYFQQVTRRCHKAIEWLPSQLALSCWDSLAFEFRYRLILEELRKKLIASRLAQMLSDLCIVAEFALRDDLNVLTQRSLSVRKRPDNILGDKQPGNFQLHSGAVVPANRAGNWSLEISEFFDVLLEGSPCELCACFA